MRNVLRVRFFITAVLCIVITLLCLSSSFAYLINDDTIAVGVFGGHEEITDYSIDKLDYGDAKLETLLRSKSVRGDIKKGDADEDRGRLLQTSTHFYDPNISEGLLDFLRQPNAMTKACSFYEEAKKKKSWEKLGHALHLLQDMAVPSHVNNATHIAQYYLKTGYEWWVAKNWGNNLSTYFDWVYSFPNNRRPFLAGSIDGFMRAMAKRTKNDGYKFDFDGLARIASVNDIIDRCISDVLPNECLLNIVHPDEAEYIAKVVIPQAINLGGGLFKRFWLDLGGPSSGPSSPGGGHPDDSFDVSSRLVELEELDPTKELWKDMYGRTGIKKGYIGLYLGKNLVNSYLKIVASTADEELATNYQEFEKELACAKAASKYSFVGEKEELCAVI